MSKPLFKSLSLLMSLTVAAPNLAQALGVSQNNTKSGIGELYGLEAVGIDSWTQILVTGHEVGMRISRAEAMIQRGLMAAKDERQAFFSLKQALRQVKLSEASDYSQLAETLLNVRQELRQRADLDRSTKQDMLFLVQMLAEEVLYVGSKKYPQFVKEIMVHGSTTLSQDQVADLREFKVQVGDVVLSKATGFGSSAFITLSMSNPHIYSHSTPTYINDKGELLSPEAEIEDGVKLRPMKKDYIEGSKTRMYIYRYSGLDVRAQDRIIEGANDLIQEMFERTGGDPYSKAAYNYDFSMTPGDLDGRGLFCSSVAYEMYNRAGMTGAENPYDPALWSPVTKARQSLLRTLNMNTQSVPAPGDLELNPLYELVGARIDVTKLHQDRVEMAIIDAFLAELEANKEQMDKLTAVLEKVAAKPLDQEKIQKLIKSKLLPESVQSKTKALEKVPDAITIKQLVFFAFLNEYMTPKIRKALLEKVATKEAEGKIVGPQELRQMVRAEGRAIVLEVRKAIAEIEASLAGE